MKTLGWIFLIIGVLSFLGAAFAGHSVFGPLFWGALGAFFLYRSSSKKKEQYNKNTIQKMKTSLPNSVTKSESVKKNDLPTYDGPTDAADIHSSLTTNQKECAICLIMFFSGFDEKVAYADETSFLISAAGEFIGIDSSPSNIKNILMKHLDGEETFQTVATINNKKVKEFIILTCYDLAKRSNSLDAFDALYNVADKMGFSKEYVKQLVAMYSTPFN